MKKSISKSVFVILLTFLLINHANSSEPFSEKKFYIDADASFFVTAKTWNEIPSGGDTIYISANRVRPLKFQNLAGTENNPIVVINSEGQVKINASTSWGAITFENCRHIKITGTGHPGFKYGFKLAAESCGLAFTELSSDCEAEFIKIDHEGFFGIYAKKDYGGNPPSPVPVFANLIIHDCFIINVTEGMYLGETKSPGMEFKHVKIYNNIVAHTGREAIQIANMVEDVEIYNNTLLNTGLDSILYQTNILQIGDNSAAHVYNNILIGAPAYGIISMGNGNNIYENNYVANCKGMFIDNRLFTNSAATISVSNNYFSNITDEEVIDNMNQVNFLNITNNTYDTEIPFYTNRSGNGSNFYLSNNNLGIIEKIIFTDPANNDYSLISETPEKFIKMGAPGGPEYFEYEQSALTPVSEQILLNANMVNDLVDGGSYYSANFLVDEQTVSVDNNEHPISQSWKPYWNMTKTPYAVYIDLGQEYTITKIALHDMHNVANLDVSVGEPDNWEFLFTEPCDRYKTWKIHETNVSTRYIQLGMNESVYAAVNEIIVYGYPNPDSLQEKGATSGNVATSIQSIGNKDHSGGFKVYPNPATDNLNIQIPGGAASDYKIEIYNMQGKLFFQKEYSSFDYLSQPAINLRENNIPSGVYLMRYTSETGLSETVKFIKKNS